MKYSYPIWLKSIYICIISLGIIMKNPISFVIMLLSFFYISGSYVNQGFIIIQSDADENLFYLALHVDHNTLKVNDGEPVYPGKELAKTIYLPDSDGVDQSHLHVSVIRLPEGTDPEDDNYGINDTQNYFLPNV